MHTRVEATFLNYVTSITDCAFLCSIAVGIVQPLWGIAADALGGKKRVKSVLHIHACSTYI